MSFGVWGTVPAQKSPPRLHASALKTFVLFVLFVAYPKLETRSQKLETHKLTNPQPQLPHPRPYRLLHNLELKINIHICQIKKLRHITTYLPPKSNRVNLGENRLNTSANKMDNITRLGHNKKNPKSDFVQPHAPNGRNA